MRYEVNQDNVVHMWDDVNPEPFLFQPHYPNGDSFDTQEEAERIDHQGSSSGADR